MRILKNYGIARSRHGGGRGITPFDVGDPITKIVGPREIVEFDYSCHN